MQLLTDIAEGFGKNLMEESVKCTFKDYLQLPPDDVYFFEIISSENISSCSFRTVWKTAHDISLHDFWYRKQNHNQRP